MLQNDKLAALTVSESFRDNEQGSIFTPHCIKYARIRVLTDPFLLYEDKI